MKLAPKWMELLRPEFEKEYMLQLKQFLSKEYQDKKIYPEKINIFKALELTDYDEVRVVIFGQDPYHGYGQANGLAFAVNPGIVKPPSLRNIFKEVSVKYETLNSSSLIGWAKQGVLLLNTVLTVEEGKPNSHKEKGWENFTNSIVDRLNEREEPVIFMLWGSSARQKKYYISKRHLILEAAHPSPLSVSGFFGCDHFDKANQYLLSKNQSIIDWSRSGE